MTDDNIYFYQAKEQSLVKEPIMANIIHELKIYNVKKAIKLLETFFNKHKVNEGLLKTKIYIIVSKTFSPAELFLFEHIFKALMNIKAVIIFEEDLIKDKKEVIIWDNYLNLIKQKRIINLAEINELEIKDIILIGISEHYQKYKDDLTKKMKINILEYENSDTILFERIN